MLAPANEPSPFEVLGVSTGFRVDSGELRRRLLRLSRLVHPDFFGTSAADERALAERNSARLNAAHEILADDVRRADWLVEHLGGPDELSERAMPQAFLLEVLEWNEQLDAARRADAGSAAQQALGELAGTLRAQRVDAIAAIAAALDPLPQRGAPRLRDVRRQLNAVRYFDRTLGEIEALRLSKAAAR
jgi:DnaJ-domain-containing protein 1